MIKTFVNKNSVKEKKNTAKTGAVFSCGVCEQSERKFSVQLPDRVHIPLQVVSHQPGHAVLQQLGLLACCFVPCYFFLNEQ